MENSAAKALSALFGEKPAFLKRIGGGAYGAIFLARLPRSSVCVKVFFRHGDAAREALWYRALKRAKRLLAAHIRRVGKLPRARIYPRHERFPAPRRLRL